MLNKVYKTILILTITLGLTIPTNAAVSVSDGSAFVTKAEFAADLNNLSNRMAQLENSLDAKIDSLVSSYLTRNGIWNGAKQMNSSVRLFYGTSQAREWLKDNTVNAVHSAVWISKTLLFSCNKSGLLFLNIVNTLPSVYVFYEYVNQYQISGMYLEDVANGSGSYSFEFYKNSDTTSSSSYIFFNISSTVTSLHTVSTSDTKVYSIICRNVPINSFNTLVNFFVSKNDNIYYQVELNTTFGNSMKSYIEACSSTASVKYIRYGSVTAIYLVSADIY